MKSFVHCCAQDALKLWFDINVTSKSWLGREWCVEFSYFHIKMKSTSIFCANRNVLVATSFLHQNLFLHTSKYIFDAKQLLCSKKYFGTNKDLGATKCVDAKQAFGLEKSCSAPPHPCHDYHALDDHFFYSPQLVKLSSLSVAWFMGKFAMDRPNTWTNTSTDR